MSSLLFDKLGWFSVDSEDNSGVGSCGTRYTMGKKPVRCQEINREVKNKRLEGQEWKNMKTADEEEYEQGVWTTNINNNHIKSNSNNKKPQQCNNCNVMSPSLPCPL